MMRVPRDLAWLAAAPLLLGGLLPLDPGVSARWGLAGRWIFPVADPYALGRPGPHGELPYQVTRNVLEGSVRHGGADLSNRHGGDVVRAAAHGIVVAADRSGMGYGVHVVLAHRMPDGSLVLSVYAHLAPGSLKVTRGEFVRMGQPLGHVGSTGVAISPHLHFEIRKPAIWDERWEKAETLDPVRFVSAALPTREADSTWARPYLLWAECAGLIDPEDEELATVTRERWWRVLAAARCRGSDLLGKPAPSPMEADVTEPVTWKEIARDLERAREAGLCLPPDSTRDSRRERDCLVQLGTKRPSRHAESLKKHRAWCTIADLALLMSDLAAR